MNFQLLQDNLTNPALLFFVLGILAVRLKSDLAIPPGSSKFISLYLLFSIGFKGGQELAHSVFDQEIIFSVVFGITTAIVVPIYSFFFLGWKFDRANSAAIAAAYGSVSAVTFVTGVSFLEMQGEAFGGHMVAVMALMEAPAIIVGVLLLSVFAHEEAKELSILGLVRHSFTNGSVFLILGSLVIGYLASEQQAQGIAPFTTDIFKGFLAVFLLDMGIVSGRKLADFWKSGWFPIAFAIVVPLINGTIIAIASGLVLESVGNRLLITLLAASASYIAVPAAMKLAIPKASPSFYIPMALGITFPFNITLGIPYYMFLINL